MKAEYQGKLLRINLSTTNITEETIPPELFNKFLGGRGMGAYYLTKEVANDVVALAEENKLIFMVGPLTGTILPGNNKVCVTFKSPLTQSYSYSHCGGNWGPELKFAGFDGLIVEGKAENPVYLSIMNNDVEIRDASHLWGKSIPQVEEILKEEAKNPFGRAAVIGPAGENLVRYACITSENYREFGRGGGGAVMGSKNLKAILLRGTQDVNHAYPKKAMAHSVKLAKNLRNSPGGKIRRQYGTPELVEIFNEHGMLIHKNFQEGQAEGTKNLYAAEMRKQIVISDSSCFMCPVGCGKISAQEIEGEKTLVMEGPEFETLGMLGPNCGITDWKIILQATEICDRFGFDTINAGGCLALAMEAFEKGLITTEDTNGAELKFGNGEALLQVLRMIPTRQGIGDILAEGPEAAAKQFGDPNLAMSSKGQNLAVYDPRGAKAMALTYATSPKGAHHMVATTMGYEINSGTRLKYENKAQLQKDHQVSMAIQDSITMCSTMRAGISLDDQAESFHLVTGIEMDVPKLKRCAERIINLERMYNVKQGFSRKHDTLPKRFLVETMEEGPTKGETVDLDRLLDDFYMIMGWDSNGIPTEAKLAELNLDAL